MFIHSFNKQSSNVNKTRFLSSKALSQVGERRLKQGRTTFTNNGRGEVVEAVHTCSGHSTEKEHQTQPGRGIPGRLPEGGVAGIMFTEGLTMGPPSTANRVRI